MADTGGLPPTHSAPDPGPPPPLSVRARPQGARGLNKPAIIISVGAAVTLVLILAASGLASPARGSVETGRELMSDPVRREAAEARVSRLPQSYEEAAALALARGDDPIPQLGPPLAGDVPAPVPPTHDPELSGGYGDNATDWSGPPSGAQYSSAAPDPKEVEAEAAAKSGLFFGLRAQSDHRNGDEPNESAASIASSPRNDAFVSPHRLHAAASATSLHPGTIIPASLVTAINSEAPGPVIAQVTQGVYDSATGEQLLIPQGARLIGAYAETRAYGQRRIAIIWSRLIMPDGAQIILDEVAVDAAGSAGAAGRVDNHWGEVFGAAVLGTLINVAAAGGDDRTAIGVTFGGVGLIASDDLAGDAVRQGVQRGASQVSSRVVDRGLAIPPTIRMTAGTRISALVTSEMALTPQQRP